MSPLRPLCSYVGAAGANRDRQHRALAGEAAFLEAHLARVGRAVREHPVEPAFQHRRRQMPPHRILQDEQVGAVQTVQLVRHHFRQTAGFGRVPLLDLRVEAGGIGPIAKMPRTLAGIEADRVEVGDGDAPACGFERRGA